MYLSKKSQVFIWQENFQLPAADFLQIYYLSCTQGKFKIYLGQKIPSFEVLHRQETGRAAPIFFREIDLLVVF